jgi:hypothetical protein
MASNYVYRPSKPLPEFVYQRPNQRAKQKYVPVAISHNHKPFDVDDLFAFCRRAVPAHFAYRDDLAQEMAMRILAKEFCRCEVNPLLVRQIDRVILKSQSEYVNISLETPNREGVRLEERLVG